MREDKYGPMLLELFNSTHEPLTPTDAAEKVGCSKQRAYAWIGENRNLLIGRGKQKFGGIGYIGKANPHFGRADLHDSGARGVDVEAGRSFEVVNVALSGGRVIVTMADEQGAMVRFQALDG